MRKKHITEILSALALIGTIYTSCNYIPKFLGKLKEKEYPKVTVTTIIFGKPTSITAYVKETSGFPVFLNKTIINYFYQGCSIEIYDKFGDGINSDEDHIMASYENWKKETCEETYGINRFTTTFGITYKRKESAGVGKTLTNWANERIENEFKPVRESVLEAIADSIKQGRFQ